MELGSWDSVSPSLHSTVVTSILGALSTSDLPQNQIYSPYLAWRLTEGHRVASPTARTNSKTPLFDASNPKNTGVKRLFAFVRVSLVNFEIETLDRSHFWTLNFESLFVIGAPRGLELWPTGSS